MKKHKDTHNIGSALVTISGKDIEPLTYKLYDYSRGQKERWRIVSTMTQDLFDEGNYDGFKLKFVDQKMIQKVISDNNINFHENLVSLSGDGSPFKFIDEGGDIFLCSRHLVRDKKYFVVESRSPFNFG